MRSPTIASLQSKGILLVSLSSAKRVVSADREGTTNCQKERKKSRKKEETNRSIKSYAHASRLFSSDKRPKQRLARGSNAKFDGDGAAGKDVLTPSLNVNPSGRRR